ncbi:MAG: hypothetical protein QXU32_02705 [Nitrososphaerales archaeon]
MTNYNESMKKKYWGITLAVALVAGLMLVTPMKSFAQVTSEEVGAQAIQLFEDCKLTNLHEDPIEMNTVAGLKGTTPIAKTIFAEKEVYKCDLDQGTVGTGKLIVDVTLYIEIYENMSTKSIVRKQAEVIICAKIEDTAAVIGCKREVPSNQSVVLQLCDEVTEIEHPMEMNTVVAPANSNIVKTVEAQKEVFKCFPVTGDPLDPPSGYLKKVDVIIFTEIWQDLNRVGTATPNPIVKRTVFSATCVTNLNVDETVNGATIKDSIRVESCVFNNHPL